MVLITVPPFSSVLLVEKLRREFPRLPIVVDFRDEWLSSTINLVSFSRSQHAQKVACNAEASAVANATAIVAVTEAARREIRARYPQEPDSKFQLIPNGFDATRFRRSALPVEIRSGNKIEVAFIGSIYGSTDPTSLVQALQSLPCEVKSRFKLRFIGHIEEPRYREALLQLGEMVELKGFVPQEEALAAVNEADYALLITHDPLNVAAKFYDYIGATKPILATVHPEGEVRRLLEELRAGWWVGSRDVEGIRRLFIETAARGNSQLASFKPDLEKIAQYERKVLAQRYASLLHSIAGRQRARDSRTLESQPAGGEG
jgi:glycosyltransferase involved in cell wall biosynthesis